MASNDWVQVDNWFSNNGPDDVSGVVLLATVGGDTKVSLPLKSRQIEARIDADIGVTETTETLTYHCEQDCTANFRFPLPPKSAVYRFEAEVDSRVIRTVTKKKERAQLEYSTAVSQGHTAVLLEQKHTDIFSIQLGNLPAAQTCIIRISYLALLEKVDDTVEYLHTSTWVPPYVRPSESVQEVQETTPTFVTKVSYDVSYKVAVHCKAGAKGVETTDKIEKHREGNVLVVKQAAAVSDPSRDFQLLIQLNQPEQTAAASSLVFQERTLNAGETKKVYKAAFFPTMPPATQQDGKMQKEMWLVVDCSGSMGGSPMDQAREAALYFVKDLPINAGVKFNIIAFGSDHRFLYKAGCRTYDATTQAEAVKWIQDTLYANMGGTEILDTMTAIYQIPVTKGYDRQVIFLTDGGIYGSQEQHIYDLVGKGTSTRTDFPQRAASAMRSFINRSSNNGEVETASTQIFCLGIGSGVHRGLLEGMASRTNGIAQYVNQDEDIARKSGLLKKCALGSGLMQRPKLAGRGCMVNMVPAVLPPVLFPGQPLMVLAEVTHAEPGASLLLTAELAGGESWTEELKLSDAVKADGDMLHVLHAMGYINELLAGSSHLHVKQNGEHKPGASDDLVEEEVVRVAAAENLVTKYTATVGVLCQLDPLDPSKVKEVDIPIELPSGRTLFRPEAERLGSVPGGADGAVMSYRSMCPPNSVVMHLQRSVCSYAGPTAQLQSCSMMSSPTRSFPSLGSTLGGLFGRVKSSKQVKDRVSSSSAPSKGGARSVMTRRAAAAPVPAAVSAGPVSAGPGCAAGAAVSANNDCAAFFPEESETRGYRLDMDCQYAMEFDAEVVEEDEQELSLFFDGMEEDEACAGSTMQQVQKEQRKKKKVSMSFLGEEEAEQGQAVSVAGAVNVSPQEALRRLNLERTAEGYWCWKTELGEMLLGAGKAGGKAKTAADLAAARPAAVGEDEWATVLVVAFLRKYLAQEKGLWEAMAQKADVWLQTRWPEEAGSRAGTILGAMKLL